MARPAGIRKPASWLCPVCGKEFYVAYPEDYVYKRYITRRGVKFLCSWHCTRDFDKTRRDRRKHA